MSDNERVKMTAEQRQIAVILVDRKKEHEVRHRREIAKINAALTSLAETVWQAESGKEIPADLTVRYEQDGQDVWVILVPFPPTSPAMMPVSNPTMDPLKFGAPA